MNEQQKRIVIILKEMLQTRKNRLQALKQTAFDMDRQRVRVHDEGIAVSIAIEALTKEIAEREKTA